MVCIAISNFDQIAGFEDEGRLILLEKMPRIEDILGIPAAALVPDD